MRRETPRKSRTSDGSAVVAADGDAAQLDLRRRRRRGGKLWSFLVTYKFFHIMVLPGIVYYVVFHYLPMVGLAIAFNDYNGMGGIMGMVIAPWVGFQNFKMGYASAMAWVLLVIILLCTLVIMRSSRRWVHYQGGSMFR